MVDPESLRGPLDALDFITGLRDTLGIPEKLLGTYLEEISATLAGTAWKHHHRRETAEELVHADFQTIEAAMTEGHPGFVDKYLAMLEAGGSKPYAELLASFGLDASGRAFWDRGLRVIATMIDELEALEA